MRSSDDPKDERRCAEEQDGRTADLEELGKERHCKHPDERRTTCGNDREPDRPSQEMSTGMITAGR